MQHTRVTTCEHLQEMVVYIHIKYTCFIKYLYSIWYYKYIKVGYDMTDTNALNENATIAAVGVGT